MESLVQSLAEVQVDDLDDQACRTLLSATLSLQRKLQTRIQSRHVIFLADALRIILPVCERHTQYYGGDGDSQNNALALALTCVAFRDEVFHFFPRSADGKRFRTGLQVQSVSRLRWAHDLGGPWNYHVCSAAAEQGMAAVVKYAMRNKCPWNAGEIAELAVPQAGQSLAALRWVIESGAEITGNAFAAAAEAGRRDAIAYMLGVVRENLDEYEDESTFGFGEATCASAAEGGHLEVLKWLRRERCEWDEGTCTDAATNGHLHVLTWAHENGCPWNSDTRRNTAEKVARARCMEPRDAVDRYLACLNYLIRHGCPRPTTNCYVCAAPPPSNAHPDGCCETCEHLTRGGRGPGYLTFTPFRWRPTDFRTEPPSRS